MLVSGTTLQETALGTVAQETAPGHFATLETESASGVSRLRDLFRVQTPEGRRVPIDAWTDAGHWYASGQMTLFQGLQRTNKFVSYDAAANRWQELPWQGDAPPLHEEDGYVYGRTALDTRRGHFYRLAGESIYRYDIEAESWERVASAPDAGYSPIAWHEALDRLINVQDGVVRSLDGDTWRELGRGRVSGQYATARHNPQRQEVMALGGEGSERAVTLINDEGDVRDGNEAPFDFQLSLDNLTYDPQSGRYLVLRWDERALWEYDAARDRWQLAREFSGDDWPFKDYGTVVPIVIDELGVVFWQYEHGPRIYRHRQVEDRRMAADTPRRQPPTRDRSTPSEVALPTTSRPIPRAHGVQPTVPEYTRPTQEPQPHERLVAIGETMEPGEWRYIGERADEDLTTYPDGYSQLRDLLYVRFCDGDDYSGGTQGNGWTNSWAYDPDTQSFWLLNMRDGSEKRLVWLDRDLNWGYESMPWGRDCSNNRRPFNRLTLVDGKLHWPPAWWGDERVRNGMMRTAPVQAYLDGDTDVEWELVNPGWGNTHSGQIGDYAVTWVPEIEGWIMQQPGSIRPWDDQGRLGISQEGHTKQGLDKQKPWGGSLLYYFRPGVDNEWQLFDTGYSRGFQGLLLYNPIKQQVLQLPGAFGPDDSMQEFGIIHLSGGQDDGPWLEKLDRIAGGREQGYSAARTYMTYHPVTGQWLWMGHDEETIWISDDAKHWEVYEDFSGIEGNTRFPRGRQRFSGGGGLFGANESRQVTPIPGTDLLLWFDYYAGLILHRMKESRPGSAEIRNPPTAETTLTQSSSRTMAEASDLADTWLYRVAASMSRGEWRSVDAALPDYVSDFGRFWNHNVLNDNSNDFWAPVALWNPVDGRTYAVLDRTAGGNDVHSVVFMSYDALDHRFLHNPLPPSEAASRFGAPHVYGRWALDVGRQKLYRFRDGLWTYDVASGEWHHDQSWEISGMGGSTSPIAMHEGMGEVLGMDQRGVITAWNPDTDETRIIGRNPDQVGRHAHAHYNWVRDEWAIAFGDGGNVATLVTADEEVIPIEIPPDVRDGGSATSFFFHDPITGNYLALEHNRRQLWEYSPERDEWRMALDLAESGNNFPRYHGYLITPIREAGVILWLHRSTASDHEHQRTYRHDSVFDGDVETAN